MGRESIHSLPLETLGHIFSLLNHEDLISASSVCRRWYQIVNGYILDRKMCAILRPEVTDYLPEHPLRRLSLIDFQDKQFNRVEDLVTDLKRLHIGYGGNVNHSIEEDALADLLQSCENLNKLSYKNVDISDSLLKATTTGLDFGTMKSITFECSVLDTNRIINILNSILFMEIKIIVRPPGKDEANLFAKYPFPYTVNAIKIPKYITEIQMDCSGLTKECYNTFKYCRKLRSLDLVNANQLNDEAVASITCLPELSKIRLSDVKNVTTDGWKTLFNCAEVTEIVLNCVSGLSNSVFENAKAATSRLDLDLQNCKRVTGEGLKSAIKIAERFSLTLDYNRHELQCLEECVTLGDAPRLRCLDITIQRLNATSCSVSSHLEKFKRNLLFYSNQHGIHFTYKEIYSKMVRNYQSVMTLNSSD